MERGGGGVVGGGGRLKGRNNRLTVKGSPSAGWESAFSGGGGEADMVGGGEVREVGGVQTFSVHPAFASPRFSPFFADFVRNCARGQAKKCTRAEIAQHVARNVAHDGSRWFAQCERSEVTTLSTKSPKSAKSSIRWVDAWLLSAVDIRNGKRKGFLSPNRSHTFSNPPSAPPPLPPLLYLLPNFLGCT